MTSVGTVAGKIVVFNKHGVVSMDLGWDGVDKGGGGVWPDLRAADRFSTEAVKPRYPHDFLTVASQAPTLTLSTKINS